jgi:alpha-N-acetylglucosamine transferase
MKFATSKKMKQDLEEIKPKGVKANYDTMVEEDNSELVDRTPSVFTYCLKTKQEKFLACLLILALIIMLVTLCQPVKIVTTSVNDYVAPVPDAWEKYYSFLDFSYVKGKNDEAYLAFFCTRDHTNWDPYYDMLRVLIYQLKMMKDSKRDIIIAICQFTPISIYETLRRLDIMVIPVQSIPPPILYMSSRWLDDCIKFNFWKLLNYNRILILDLDLYLQDHFVEIWDEPASQIKYSPPTEYGDEDTYMGFKIKSLYPYVYAGTIDSWILNRSLPIDKFNAGMQLLKPSLAHYHLIMQTVYNNSLIFAEVDQSILNLVYNITSPVAWSKLSYLYNYFPEYNPPNEKVRAYHYKFLLNEHHISRSKVVSHKYKDLLFEKTTDLSELEDLWNKDYDKMISDTIIYDPLVNSNLPNISDYILISSQARSITILNLEASNQEGYLYAVASTNILDCPTVNQIKDRFDASGTRVPGANATCIDGQLTSITIDELAPSTSYMIYYCSFSTKTGQFSGVYYIYYNTKQ